MKEDEGLLWLVHVCQSYQQQPEVVASTSNTSLLIEKTWLCIVFIFSFPSKIFIFHTHRPVGAQKRKCLPFPLSGTAGKREKMIGHVSCVPYQLIPLHTTTRQEPTRSILGTGQRKDTRTEGASTAIRARRIVECKNIRVIRDLNPNRLSQVTSRLLRLKRVYHGDLKDSPWCWHECQWPEAQDSINQYGLKTIKT